MCSNVKFLYNFGLIKIFEDWVRDHAMAMVLFCCPSCLPTVQTFSISIHEADGSSGIPEKLSYSISSGCQTTCTYLRIETSGIASKQVITFLPKSSSFDVGGRRRYCCLALPQHCSIKLISQWNFGEKWTENPWARQNVSNKDSSSAKSGSLKSIHRQQQVFIPTGQSVKLFPHCAFLFDTLYPCSVSVTTSKSYNQLLIVVQFF
jgi:hypothetical protein